MSYVELSVGHLIGDLNVNNSWSFRSISGLEVSLRSSSSQAPSDN